MKDFRALVGIFVAVLLATLLGTRLVKPLGNASTAFIYSSPTMATSSVGIYTPSLVLSASGGRQFASFCNKSNALPTTNDSMFLMLGSTTTGASGIMIKPQACYEMNAQNMFVGNVYALASTSTTTLLMLYK